MPTNVKLPTEADVRATLGSAGDLWSGIFRVVESLASPIDAEWKPSKGEFGRMCLLRHKKRTLLYLTPQSGAVTVAMVLGQRAYDVAMASALPTAIKKALSEAKPYAEGRGIRFVLRSQRDMSSLKALVEIKTAPK